MLAIPTTHRHEPGHPELPEARHWLINRGDGDGWKLFFGRGECLDTHGIPVDVRWECDLKQALDYSHYPVRRTSDPNRLTHWNWLEVFPALLALLSIDDGKMTDIDDEIRVNGTLVARRHDVPQLAE